MKGNKKIVVVLPAFNAGKTLEKTFTEIPGDIVDDVLLVDDKSSDNTTDLARELGIKHIIQHDDNKGYGGNQKTCYTEALALDADIIIMLHPDYQYTPRLIPAMVAMIDSGHYDLVLGSRILGKGALKGGMPVYKYIANRLLTFFQNIMMGQKLSEYHTGYRAFTKEVLKSIPFEDNSDGFIFDNEILAQICYKSFSIGEISCPTHYDEEASSIKFKESIKYGWGVVRISFQYLFHKKGIFRSKLFMSEDI